jgi:hypothetical protein
MARLDEEVRVDDLPASEAMKSVIARCTAPRPDGRYQSAAHLLRDLKGLAKG